MTFITNCHILLEEYFVVFLKTTKDLSMANHISSRPTLRWKLVFYDVLVLVATSVIILYLLSGGSSLGIEKIALHTVIYAVFVISFRLLFRIYSLVWRYGGIQGYLRLMFADFFAFIVYFAFVKVAGMSEMLQIRMLAFALGDLVVALGVRMIYRYAYKYGNPDTAYGRFLMFMIRTFAHLDMNHSKAVKRVKIAILGAGHVGVSLASELLGNVESMYEPVCFIDVSTKKTGREIMGLPVYLETDSTIQSLLVDLNVQQVVITIRYISSEKKMALYERYKSMGFSVKTYDAPVLAAADAKPLLRPFSVEELLFRRQQTVVDDNVKAYYKDKVILITGGGGSIGSEICRQLATMSPKQIIILDVYENGAYNVQQEIRFKYKNAFSLNVEICSITNIKALERVFEAYHPQIVINAAAHKHVPLMEHNCIEAIENNVFGCKNVIDCCEKYGAERFMMVSTDKAVNPTNVMGATKRMCEMLVQSASVDGQVKYSSTRFGNVLGSAGSVIPLFKKQIAAGGPVTITDKRITRYFMTIPEASQLVLVSGAMAKNGDLFVLDMGQPVKILDLAQNMIRIMGAKNIEIIETGLRPGEKLYEELLIKTEKLTETENEKIFIEEDEPLSKEEIENRLSILSNACKSGDDEKARAALHKVVPSFVRPEDINGK